MEKENNIVYVKTKNGICKCYESEQMHKPIYYPVENKTNGFIDYNEVINILSIDDLYNELKKQKEINKKAIEYIEKFVPIEEDTILMRESQRDYLLEILEGKEETDINVGEV